MATAIKTLATGLVGSKEIAIKIPEQHSEHRSLGEVKSLLASVPPLVSDDTVHSTVASNENLAAPSPIEEQLTPADREEPNTHRASVSHSQQVEQTLTNTPNPDSNNSAEAGPAEHDIVAKTPAIAAPDCGESPKVETPVQSKVSEAAGSSPPTQEEAQKNVPVDLREHSKEGPTLEHDMERPLQADSKNAEAKLLQEDAILPIKHGSYQSQIQQPVELQQAPPVHPMEPEPLKVSVGRSKVFRIQQSAYVSPDLPMEPAIANAWTQQAQQRLEREILQTIGSSSPDNFSIVLQCMMAGKSRSNLKPHVVIFCSTEALRKKLAKGIKASSWISTYGLGCLVAVHPVLRLASPTPTPTPTPVPAPSSSLSTGAVVGIGVGVGLGVIVAIAAVVTFLRHRKHKSNDTQRFDEMPYPARPWGKQPEMGKLGTAAEMPSSLTVPRHELSSFTSPSTLVPTELASTTSPKQETDRSPPKEQAKPVLEGQSDSNHGEQYHVRSLCGVPLNIPAFAEGQPSRTLGGLLLVDGWVVGITAAHGIENAKSLPRKRGFRWTTKERDVAFLPEGQESPFINFNGNPSDDRLDHDSNDQTKDQLSEEAAALSPADAHNAQIEARSRAVLGNVKRLSLVRRHVELIRMRAK